MPSYTFAVILPTRTPKAFAIFNQCRGESIPANQSESITTDTAEISKMRDREGAGMLV